MRSPISKRRFMSRVFVESLESRELLAANLDLTGYTLSFADEFNGTSVSVTNQSPKGSSTYYYWPPYGAAGAYSASQWDTAAISAGGGVMQLKAFKDAQGNWHSGNISSMDHTGAGFAQTYGYWEIRAKMPDSGVGSWPAFWLMSKNSILNNLNGTSLPNEEIDVFEWYGVARDNNEPFMQQASHNWTPQPDTAEHVYSPQTPMPGGAFPWQGFHTYGLQVDPQKVTWYIDGVATNQINTPTAYITSPFYFMVDYALGGGWPLDGVVNNSHMDVDYVRVYSLPAPKPAAPSNLTATATSSSQINLAWADNSANETGFKIERATNSTFTSNLTTVATTAANTKTYSNTGLSAGTTYFYRVTALGTGGNSAASNTASATTQSTSTTVTLQAESAALSGGTIQSTEWSGYNGTGFADFGGNGSAVQFTVNRASAGNVSLAFRYANASKVNRPLTVYVNNVSKGALAFAATTTWTTWTTVTLNNIALNAGNNTIKLVAGSGGGPNLDQLVVSPAAAVLTTFRINAGGSAYTTSGGVAFSADSGFTGGTVGAGVIDITNTTDDALYGTRRFGTNFSFAKAVVNGSYTLRLYFAETTHTSAGKRVFSVKAENNTILSNFDLFTAAGYRKALTRSFDINVTDGTLNLAFMSTMGDAIISGIELIPR